MTFLLCFVIVVLSSYLGKVKSVNFNEVTKLFREWLLYIYVI